MTGLFRPLLLAAVLAGLVVGTVVSLVQAAWVTPLIRAAEVYEVHEGHDHGEEAWEPAPGIERATYTWTANVVLATGQSLLLGAALLLLGRHGWRAGLLTGLVGYASFVLAPSLGLPPELPGTAAAELGARQAWWVLAAGATAAGLGLVLMGRRPWAMAAGLALILVPHLVGAPHPPAAAGTVPHALTLEFIPAVLASQLVAWALLGGLTGLLLAHLTGGGRAVFGRAAA
jgi:cobalt transporter subunit CbtA